MPRTGADAGITFTGTDKNLSKTLDGVTGKLDLLWSKLGTMAAGASKMGGQMASGIGAAMGKGKQLIGGFANAIDAMSQKALQPSIDKPFAQMYAQFAKTFGELTVGMKMSQKEARRLQSTIGSMAHGMNASLEGTAKSYLAFRQQGVDLAKVLGTKGLRGTIKRLIQITNTFGIEGEQMAVIASSLIKGFGFTEDKVRGLMGAVFKMGKAFGFGRQAMQQLPGLIKEIDDQTAHFLKEASPEQIEGITKSIMKMGLALQRSLGGTFEDSLEMSKKIFGVLVDERKNFTDMFAGVGGEMGEVLRSAATAGGFKKAMEMIYADPAKFMGLLGKMTKSTTGDMGIRFVRLRKKMTKVFGPKMAHLMNKMKGGWKEGADAMSKADKAAADTKKNMTALGEAAAKAFKSGLTAGDAYDRMLKSYQARVMKLSDPALGKWIENQKAGFKTFHDRLEGVVKRGGPLGELTKRLLLVQRVGMSGFFTGLGNFAPMISNVVTQMAPMLSALSSLGVTMMMLGKLLMPGGILLLGLALFHKGMREKIVGAAEKAFDYLKENIPKWWPKIKEGLTLMWKKAVEGVQWLMEVVTPMMNSLAGAIAKVDWGGITKRVIGGMGKFLRGVWYGITGMGESFANDSTTLGRFQLAGMNLASAIGQGMLQVLRTVASSVWGFFTVWTGDLKKDLRHKGALIGGAFVVAMLFGSVRKMAFQGAVGLVRLITATLFTPLLTQMKVTMSASLSVWAKTWFAMRVVALKNAIWIAKAWFMALGPVGKIVTVVGALVVAFGTLKQKLVVLAPVAAIAMSALLGPIGPILAGVGFLIYKFGVIGKVASAAFGAVKTVASAAISVLEFVGEKLRRTGEIAGFVIDDIESMFYPVTQTIAGVAQSSFETIKSFGEGLLEAYKSIGSGIKFIVKGVSDYLKERFPKAMGFIKRAWKKAGSAVNTVTKGIGRAWDSTASAMSNTWDNFANRTSVVSGDVMAAMAQNMSSASQAASNNVISHASQVRVKMIQEYGGATGATTKMMVTMGNKTISVQKAIAEASLKTATHIVDAAAKATLAMDKQSQSAKDMLKQAAELRKAAKAAKEKFGVKIDVSSAKRAASDMEARAAGMAFFQQKAIGRFASMTQRLFSPALVAQYTSSMVEEAQRLVSTRTAGVQRAFEMAVGSQFKQLMNDAVNALAQKIGLQKFRAPWRLLGIERREQARRLARQRIRRGALRRATTLGGVGGVGGAGVVTTRGIPKFRGARISPGAAARTAAAKQKVVETRIDTETQRQVGDLATEISHLAGAIRALSIDVVVSGTPEFKRFINAAKKRKGGAMAAKGSDAPFGTQPVINAPA